MDNYEDEYICVDRHISDNISWREKLYLYISNTSKPICYCGGHVSFISAKLGYREYCSTKCQSNSIKTIEKRKKTNLKKYGHEYVLENKDIKDSISKTIKDKYGVDNISQSNDIKLKKKNTTQENYGVDYNSQRPVMRDINSRSMTIRNIETNTDRHINYWKNKLSEYSLEFINKEVGSVLEIKCSDFNHTFKIHKTMFNDRVKNKTPICTVCYPINNTCSLGELELYNYISSIYHGEIIQSYRDGLEIDVYLPDLNIGFEYNGLYWHSEEFRDKRYHLDKVNYFKEREIRIIHIWEDDWKYNTDIIRSQVRNLLNLTEKKIFARKCVIEEVKDSKICSEFFNENHIQGKVNSSLKLGLFFDGEMVGLMTFDHFEGRGILSGDEWNLNRFCTKTNHVVVGGASKLINYFIKVYNPNRIISYADKSWSLGKLYENLGFNKLYETDPDYKYVVGDKRIHKSNFKKSKFKNGLSESENMGEFSKIYDCGKIKYEYIIYDPMGF